MNGLRGEALIFPPILRQAQDERENPKYNGAATLRTFFAKGR